MTFLFSYSRDQQVRAFVINKFRPLKVKDQSEQEIHYPLDKYLFRVSNKRTTLTIIIPPIKVLECSLNRFLSTGKLKV